MTALLDAGANVDEPSGTGKTPLHYAIYQGRTAAVHLLLDRGANVSRFDSMGNTVYSNAAVMLGQIDHNGFTQLPGLDLPTARKTLEEIMSAIRAGKPDSNWRNEAGETALMCAAQIGSTIPLSVPPGETVNVNAQRPDGMTALMLAIITQPKNAPRDGPGSVGIMDGTRKNVVERFSGRGHVVKALREMGADLSVRNQAGKTALDLARENGNEEILQLLQKAKE